MKTQLEEDKRINEVKKSDLDAKKKVYRELEQEVVNLRNELEKCKDDLKIKMIQKE